MSDEEEGGRGGLPHYRANPPPLPSQPPTPHPPQKSVRKNGSPSSLARRATTQRYPVTKSPPPTPTTTTTARPTKPVSAPKPTNPPKTATAQPPPPPSDQDRHPQGCREEGRMSRGSDRRDGRPRTVPHRGRERHRPWYTRTDLLCRPGEIPGRHHPLRGGPAPPLPQPRGGRAIPGRRPVGQEKVETPAPTNEETNRLNPNPATEPTNPSNPTNPPPPRRCGTPLRGPMRYEGPHGDPMGHNGDAQHT